MKISDFDLPWRGAFEQHLVYEPSQKPGFAAWATAFPYQDGTLGLSFDEIRTEKNLNYSMPKLELGEASGVPVSYCAVECGDRDHQSYRVFMRSEDGIHFYETGRCPRREGSICNAGFPDGRIVGFDVPRINEKGTGWGDYIRVRESFDGGKTWSDVCRLMEGAMPYMWRVRRLKNGELIILASISGLWGPGEERPTRNSLLPGENWKNRNQPFFFTSEDGHQFKGPYYILPGIGAHEYDVVELPDGRLLFIAGDVQGTPTGRQFVTKSGNVWLNGCLLPIRKGAPDDAVKNPQGGYVPETVAWDNKHNCIIGYRRGKGFSISNDFGENWFRLKPDGMKDILYQPYLLELADGTLGLYGHIGGDNAFGERNMTIQAQILDPECADDMRKPSELSLFRKLSQDNRKYMNDFMARLTVRNDPVKGEKLEFRINAYWREDGSVNTTKQEDALLKIDAVTDENGYASVHISEYDGIADIHLAYNIDVVFAGSDTVSSCCGPMMTVLALTPERLNKYPYDAYFAAGTLYLSPLFLDQHPDAMNSLREICGECDELPENIIPAEAEDRLLRAGVLKRVRMGGLSDAELSNEAPDSASDKHVSAELPADGRNNDRLLWIHSVHAPRVLDDVKPMGSPDCYC